MIMLRDALVKIGGGRRILSLQTTESALGFTYSSRIQLPTEFPPQLMPVTILPASDSLRGLSRLEVFMEIGCAPLRAFESRRPYTALMALLDDAPPLISMAPEGRVSLPVVG